MADLEKYKEYKTILSVNALIWAGGKLLLIKRADNKEIDPGIYSGIGGKVEPGEDFYSALLREIKEETGLTEFKSIRPYSITQHPYPSSTAEWIGFYFIVELEEQILIPANEEGEFLWVDPKDIDSLPMVTDLKDYIKILSKNPKAFILGFFDHDDSGEITSKVKIKIL
jgi:8-oxo-dGTP diphosphatase